MMNLHMGNQTLIISDLPMLFLFLFLLPKELYLKILTGAAVLNLVSPVSEKGQPERDTLLCVTVGNRG